MDRTTQIFLGGWMSDSLSVFTRGWWGGVSAPPTPAPATGAGGYYQRRTLIPMPPALPRRRRYGWIDIEDEELLLIIDDIEVV